MSKRFIVRATLVMLTLVMLFSVVSCAAGDGGKNDDNATNSNGTTAKNDSTSNVTDAVKPDPIPSDVKFDGKKMTVLYWSDVEHPEFFANDQTGNVVDDALIVRNTKVEERLGIELVWEPQEGDAGKNLDWNNRMKAIIADNDTAQYTCFAGYSLSVAAAALKGYCANLMSDNCSYLNFGDNTYWPERLLEEITFGDNLYFCSGDISANALYMMYVCFVNTDMLTDHELPNPQEYVEDGNWTYTRFITMCENIYDDTDDVAGKSAGDTFGYMTGGVHTDVWFYGTGALIAEYNEDGKLCVSDSFNDERIIDAHDRITNLIKTSNDMIHTGTGSGDVKHQDAFGEGRVLFIMDRCRVSFKVIAGKNYDVKYAILPCPKYNPSQENYVTLMGNPFTLYGIFAGTSEENQKMGAAFLEYYAYESYNVVTPAVFELSLKTRYVQDDLSARMYDIVRENLSFDIGRIFSDAVLDGVGGQSFMRNLFTSSGSQGWKTTTDRIVDIMNRNLEKIQTKLDKSE